MRLRLAIERTVKRRIRLVLSFRRDERGATAVEFALVSIPFFMLLAAIIEIAMMFWTTQVLEEALSQTSRSLLTGQAQSRYTGTATANRDRFKTDLCNNAAFPLIACDKLFVDIKTYSTFGAATTGTNNPVSGGAMNTSAFSYTQPQAGQIVVVRAALEYPLFFTQWSSALANLGAGKRGIVATTAFKTEPFV